MDRGPYPPPGPVEIALEISVGVLLVGLLVFLMTVRPL